MTRYDIENVRIIFSRLFVLASNHKMHPMAFTRELADSDFIKKIEANKYDDYFNKSIVEIFESIVTSYIKEDDSFGVYNDAFWSGVSYFYLYEKTHKPFSYLFLKLPLEQLLDLYPVYHEMDLSSLFDLFQEREKEKTILRILCQQYHTSLSKISKATSISVNTLSKYNASDEALYKASFQNIIRIANYFDVPSSLFVEKL